MESVAVSAGPGEGIIAVMCAAGDGLEGVRLRGVIIVLWRAAPTESAYRHHLRHARGG